MVLPKPEKETSSSVGASVDNNLSGALALSLQAQYEQMAGMVTAANASIEIAGRQIAEHFAQIANGEALAVAVMRNLAELKQASQYQVSGFNAPKPSLPPLVDVAAEGRRFREAVTPNNVCSLILKGSTDA